MNHPSAPSSANGILVAALKEWIRLLQQPAGGGYYVRELQDIVESMDRDDGVIRVRLTTGEIWGGMGSLLDSAVARYESGIPASTVLVERAAEWEETHRELHQWNIEFSRATIQVGTALLEWCRENDGIEPRDQLQIERWIEWSAGLLATPYRPLDAACIASLEHNLAHGVFLKSPRAG